MITSIKSPFLEYKMTILRNKKTSNSLFRQTMNEASYLIAAEVLKYLKYKNIIREDTILFFNGEVFIDDYDSQLSMRAENVFTLNAAREKFSKYIRIILSSEHISKDNIFDLKKIITKYSTGKTKVILSYKNRDVIAPIDSKEDLFVNINDKFLSEIRSITGEDNVQIKYH